MDPDPYWIRIGIQPKILDPDPDEINADPQPCFFVALKKFLSVYLLCGSYPDPSRIPK